VGGRWIEGMEKYGRGYTRKGVGARGRDRFSLILASVPLLNKYFTAIHLLLMSTQININTTIKQTTTNPFP
jgi:hypothetical protein